MHRHVATTTLLTETSLCAVVVKKSDLMERTLWFISSFSALGGFLFGCDVCISIARILTILTHRIHDAQRGLVTSLAQCIVYSIKLR